MRRMMLISGLTTALGIAADSRGHRLSGFQERRQRAGRHGAGAEGRAHRADGGVRRSGHRDTGYGGVTEIRSFDARTLREVARLRFAQEP